MSNLNKFKKSTVAILTAMLLISIAMPLLVGTVGAATATISLGKTSQGPCGTVVTVTGSGFAPNTPTSLTFGGAVVSAWTVTTDINGAIPAASKFTVGSNIAPGQYYVIVTDNAGHSASAIFTITTPVVNIAPGTGIAGSSVYLTASGFAPGTVTATLNGAPVTLTTSTISASGTLTTTFDVPPVTFTTAYPTTLTLTLLDSKGNVGTATYTVGSTTVSVSPASAAVGSKVTVSGTGFSSGATVTIAYGATPTPITSAIATSAGTFSTEITVPLGLVQGAVTIVAYETGALKTNGATTQLTVKPNVVITMEDATGDSGTNIAIKNDAAGGIIINVELTGFAASSPVTFSWIPTTPASTFIAADLVTSPTGAKTITSNAGAAFTSMGTWTLTVTDAAGNTATAQIVVSNTGNYWTISPASGPVGTEVTATYFGGANSVAGHITVNGQAATMVPAGDVKAVTSAYPTSATVTFVVPSLSAGRYPVSGTGDWAAFAGLATFTVTGSPSVELSQTSAAKGQVVGITGSGFLAGSTVTVSILGNPLTTTPATITATGGAIAASFTVPNFQPGTYDVIITDAAYNSVMTSLTITTPSVTLSKSSIQLGPVATPTKIYFNATGFAAGSSAFTVTIDGSATGVSVETDLMDRPNGFGVAYGLFTVSTASSLLAGQHTLAITDAQGNTYTQKITIQPSITLNPTAAPAGNTVTLTGSAFSASSKLSLALNGTYLQLYTSGVAGASTSPAGAISGVTFTIPENTAGGNYIITVSDDAIVNNTQTASFTVTSPTLTLTPNTGAAGITVTIEGAGWLPGRTAGTVSWGTTILRSDLTTGSAGSTNGIITGGNTFTVPQVPAGDYTVTVSDGVESLTATFTVATAAITLNAATAQVGDIINVTGTGFNPGVTILLGTNAHLYFGGASVTTLAAGYTTPVTFANGTLGCTQIATATQVQGIPFVVPAGSVAGTNTVTLTFVAPALSSSQTVTVVPKITSTATGILKGTPVTIIANGFAASSLLSATLNGAPVTLGSAITSSIAPLGEATPTFNIPVTATTGANTLVITDAAGNSATMTITVGTPSIASLSATSGPAGTSVQVTGTGFFLTAANQIFISFDGVTLATNPTTVSTSTGSFIAFITVPAGATVGAHTITATDSNNNQATASFEVTQGSAGSALPDQTTMTSTAKTTTTSGTATTTFTAGSTVKASFSLQSQSGSRDVVVAVTFQQGAKVYNMASFQTTMDTTARTVSFSNLIPAGATGTWTAQLQVFAADGVTALGVTTLTFTVA